MAATAIESTNSNDEKDRNRMSKGNVARTPVFICRDGVEVFLDNPLSPRQSIASAHWEIMTDRTMADGDFPPARSLQRKNSVIFTACGEWGFYDRYGRGIAKWELHDIQERSRSSSISVQLKNASTCQMC